VIVVAVNDEPDVRGRDHPADTVVAVADGKLAVEAS
jgi:hypothetical protein